MAFWAVEVKPGEPYIHEPSRRGCLRITQATLGNLESVGWSTLACSVGGMTPVRLCALNSTSSMYGLDLEYDEEQNVFFTVIGDSSVHLAGYYKIPCAAANIQALVTKSQEADDCEATHVHDIALQRNALDTELVHDDDGTNQKVQQAGLNINTRDAAANVQALVTKSQEADDRDTTHVHDIAQEHNARDTEVRNDVTNPIVGQAGRKISDGASLGSTHRPGYKEDVGGPKDKLQIEELKSGDSNAEIASDGKRVKVKYIGSLKNGEVIDSAKGGYATHKFTLGVDQVIPGWHQGIQGMRVGGKRRLTIHPDLAYKDIPQERIPANSWLVYDIELLEVSEPHKKKPKKKSRSVNHH